MKLPQLEWLNSENISELLKFGVEESLLAGLLESQATLFQLANVFLPFQNPATVFDFFPGFHRKSSEAAEELPDLSSRYQVLVEQIPAVVFMAFFDKGLSEAYVSPHIESLLGFTQAEWLNDPVRWFEQLHPEDKTRWSMEAAHTFLTGDPLRSVYRVLARNGRVVWFHAEVKMVRHRDGRPWYIHGVAFEITELKEAEAALRTAHTELEDRVRRRTRELADANFFLESEIAERKRAEAELVKARDELEMRVRERTEELVLANVELRREIAERRRAETALSQSEEMLRAIFESAPDAMVVVNHRGQIERVNAQVEQMFGYRADDLAGHPVELLMPARFTQSHQEHRARYIRSPHLRDMGAGLELFARRRDGTEFPAEIMLSPIESETGRMVIAVVRDISHRKQTEADLREYAERLQILSRRLMEVQEAERRRIALELHDEIGQALTGLKFTLDLNARQASTEAQQKNIALSQQIVNELMARVRKLSLDLRPGMLDDLGLLPALLWLIESYTTQTHVRIAFRHRGLKDKRFAPEVETAAYRIVQEALTNIARHAEVDEATIRTWVDHQTITIQIEDRGKGFDVDGVLSVPVSSGLAGMRERVLLLDGTFTIESKPGRGTRVTAELKLRTWGNRRDEG